MKIAVSSDEYYPFHERLVGFLQERGDEVLQLGSLLTKKETSWVDATQEAVWPVYTGGCQEAIVMCWSGTGASIAANKVGAFPPSPLSTTTESEKSQNSSASRIRAALCWDPETAKLARIWNHANVLVLPNRILDEKRLEAILSAWFEAYDPQTGQSGIDALEEGNRRI